MMLRDPITNPQRGDQWLFAEHELTVAAVSQFEVCLFHDLSGEFVVYVRDGAKAELSKSDMVFDVEAAKWTFKKPQPLGFDSWWHGLPALLPAAHQEMSRRAFEAGRLLGAREESERKPRRTGRTKDLSHLGQTALERIESKLNDVHKEVMGE